MTLEYCINIIRLSGGSDGRKIHLQAAKEYARGDVTTNTVEGYFAILKRGLIGTFHHVSAQHLQRYVEEFDFRYNSRSSLGVNDTERAALLLKGIGGKRLTYY